VATPVNGGYGSFTVEPKMMKGQFNIIPITESILGLSEEKDKAKIVEFAQLAGNFKDENGKDVISKMNLAKEMSPYYGIDFEKLTGRSEQQKTAEQIMEEMKAGGK